MQRIFIIAMLAVILVIMMTGTAFADIILINFDTNTSPSYMIRSGTLSTQGFDFTSEHFHVWSSDQVEYSVAGTGGYLVGDGYRLGRPVTMASSQGLTFSLLSLDASRLWNSDVYADYGFLNGAYIDLLGYGVGGNTYSAEFLLNSPTSFATFSLSGWDDLTSVVFSSNLPGVTDNASWAADNILVDTNVSAVPEPTSLLLLGAGIGMLGIGAWRKKK